MHTQLKIHFLNLFKLQNQTSHFYIELSPEFERYNLNSVCIRMKPWYLLQI